MQNHAKSVLIFNSVQWQYMIPCGEKVISFVLKNKLSQNPNIKSFFNFRVLNYGRFKTINFN